MANSFGQKKSSICKVHKDLNLLPGTTPKDCSGSVWVNVSIPACFCTVFT
ncbi:hypothetical protein XENTR_v10018861 [Xenopus tropicalis]|nr:hypothetical protein XENTR_v10018861 [Xenopus tropicalis]